MIKIIFDEKKNQAVAYDGVIQIGECDFLETEEYWNITHTLLRVAFICANIMV